MKYTIEGFSQEYAASLKKEITENGKAKVIRIDCTDLVILRWFVDFFPSMTKINVGGKEYALLVHSKMMSDLPILNISRKACIERMQKLVKFGILEYKLVEEAGRCSFYGFGENYKRMIENQWGEKQGVENQWVENLPIENRPLENAHEKDEDFSGGDVRLTDHGDVRLTDHGDVRLTDHNYSIINNNTNNTSIKNNISLLKESIKEIVSFLNAEAGKAFRDDTPQTVKLISGRLKNGYTVDDFKTVIRKKCAEWMHTDMEQYLRPATLFTPTHFESYLNAPEKASAQARRGRDGKMYGDGGIAIIPPEERDPNDDLPF